MGQFVFCSYNFVLPDVDPGNVTPSDLRTLAVSFDIRAERPVPVYVCASAEGEGGWDRRLATPEFTATPEWERHTLDLAAFSDHQIDQMVALINQDTQPRMILQWYSGDPSLWQEGDAFMIDNLRVERR